jgi:hypothetical protein
MPSDLISEFLPDSSALVFVKNGTYVAQFNWDGAFIADGPNGVGTGDTADAAILAAINQAKERR